MSETALILPELTAAVHDPYFSTRLALTGTRSIISHKEAAFTVRKFGDDITYSEVLMPEDARENGGRDPSRAINVDKIVFPHSRIDPNMAAFIHGHPGNASGHQEYLVHPSPADLRLFANRIHPVHPGHIGGIVVSYLAPMIMMKLLLYRAHETEFDRSALTFSDELSAEEAAAIPDVMQRAGIRHATLLFISKKIIGLEKLAELYE